MRRPLLFLVQFLAAFAVDAATYQVGPAHPPNTTLALLFTNIDLEPGDIVEVRAA